MSWRSPVVLLVAMAVPAVAQEPDPRSITASGDAEVRVVPDEVVLRVGVETRSKELEEAKSDNDSRVTAVLAAAKEADVPRTRMKTDFLGIQPYYDTSTRRTFVGYRVRRSIQIVLNDISRFEPLLTAVLDAGATHVHDVDFRTTELREHRDRARTLAIDAAREKAELLAGRLGQHVGRPLTINEGSSRWWSGYGAGWRHNWSSGPSQNVAYVSSSSTGQPEGPMSPGELAVSASVSVEFELLDEAP